MPVRVDRLLHDWLGGSIGRRRLASILARGDVRLNGRRASKGSIVGPGDELVVRALPLPTRLLTATPAPLSIVYVDDHLVAVDKPPGLPTVGGSQPRASLASILLASFPEMAAIDPCRAAGLVHRLDTGTSGLVLAARHRAMHQRLRAHFRAKAIVKDYLAVVHGRVPAGGRVDLPLRRHPRSRKRVVPARPGDRGWLATTEFQPLRVTGDLTLVHLRMRTGVTHQLRVHMAALGHPILGDARYRPRAVSHATDRDTGSGWHYLHASALQLPGADVPRRLLAPFPAHWGALFERLGWPCGGDQ